MPFDWMHAGGSPRAGSGTRKAMYEQEVRERAALLRRLGHGKTYVQRRCAGNLDEEFASFSSSPLLKKEVAALVGEVFE